MTLVRLKPDATGHNLVREGREPSLGDKHRIEIAHRARCRVARVLEERLAEAAASSDAFVEGFQFVFVVRIVEAEHRRQMLDCVEALDWPSRDTLRRGIGGDEIGIVRFELLELVEEAVELFVGDLGIGVDVVTLFVMADLVTKLFDALFRRRLAHARESRVRQPRMYRTRAGRTAPAGHGAAMWVSQRAR